MAVVRVTPVLALVAQLPTGPCTTTSSVGRSPSQVLKARGPLGAPTETAVTLGSIQGGPSEPSPERLTATGSPRRRARAPGAAPAGSASPPAAAARAGAARDWVGRSRTRDDGAALCAERGVGYGPAGEQLGVGLLGDAGHA